MLSDVKKTGSRQGPPSSKSAGASRVGAEILKATSSKTTDKAKNEAKAKNSPKAPHLRAHRVHIERHIRVANARKNRAELEEEARRHHIFTADGPPVSADSDLEVEERVIEGLNFDERRKKKGRQQQDRDDEEQEDGEEAEALAQAAREKGFATDAGAGKYFQDVPQDRLGDLTLDNPEEMKRLLGPSVRFAKHAMLLAEERLKNGATRDEAVSYLAELYVGIADRSYASKALREFGAGTGIIDLYPLEVIEHLLENVPTFFNRVTKERFFTSSKTGVYKGETGKPIVLTYDPALRIRGFAIKEGAKPGYLFEPVDPPGTYHLTFRSPGTYTVIVSAISKNGSVAIEELTAEVALGRSSDFDDAAAIKRERAHEAGDSADGDGDPERATPGDAKKDDLKISFPRRI